MNARITLGLVVIGLLLGAYIYIFELDRTETGANDISLYGTTYGEYDILKFEVAAPEGTVSFVRTDQTPVQEWKMVAPADISPDELDQVRINGAATRMGRLVASQVITDATDLARYGLQAPQLTTTLTISNGQKITLYAGASAPVGESRYVRTAGDDRSVYLVFDFAIEDLYRLVEELPYAPTPLPPPPSPTAS